MAGIEEGSSPWILTMREAPSSAGDLGDPFRPRADGRGGHLAGNPEAVAGRHDPFVIGGHDHLAPGTWPSSISRKPLNHWLSEDEGQRLARKTGRTVSGRNDPRRYFQGQISVFVCWSGLGEAALSVVWQLASR